jgi:carbamoyl-phosphate synthase large subunit
MTLKLFIRQSFTEATPTEVSVVQAVLDTLAGLDGNPYNLELLTGKEASGFYNFHETFEQATGITFTPNNFRNYRLNLLSQADGMIYIRTGLSESGAFETAYNIFQGKQAPLLFLIWDKTPIKTTLLQELDCLLPCTYLTFSEPKQLVQPLLSYLEEVVALKEQKKN